MKTFLKYALAALAGGGIVLTAKSETGQNLIKKATGFVVDKVEALKEKAEEAIEEEAAE